MHIAWIITLWNFKDDILYKKILQRNVKVSLSLFGHLDKYGSTVNYKYDINDDDDGEVV